MRTHRGIITRRCDEDAGGSSSSSSSSSSSIINTATAAAVVGDNDSSPLHCSNNNDCFISTTPKATSAQSIYKGQIIMTTTTTTTTMDDEQRIESTAHIADNNNDNEDNNNNNKDTNQNDDSILQYSPAAIRRSLFPASGGEAEARVGPQRLLRLRLRRRRFVHPHRGNNNNNNNIITQQQQQQQQKRRRSSTSTSRIPLIPAEHPLKVAWDFLTVILSFLNAYATHTSIRDRQFANNTFLYYFCEVWFAIDILLNFCSEYKTGDGLHLTNVSAVWARYLTTWFAVDLISLFPGEILYLQPIIDQQNRRTIFQKSFFRTKAVLRVTRFLRGYHFKYFGQVAKQTKRAANVGRPRLLRLIIKYVPKYWLFLRNMKAVVAIRLLRQIHWLRKVYFNARNAAAVIHQKTGAGNNGMMTTTTTTMMINKPLNKNGNNRQFVQDDDDEATYSMTEEDYYDLDSYDDDDGYFSISSLAEDGRDLFEDSFHYNDDEDDNDEDDNGDNRVQWELDDDDDDDDDDEYGPY